MPKPTGYVTDIQIKMKNKCILSRGIHIRVLPRHFNWHILGSKISIFSAKSCDCCVIVTLLMPAKNKNFCKGLLLLNKVSQKHRVLLRETERMCLFK